MNSKRISALTSPKDLESGVVTEYSISDPPNPASDFSSLVICTATASGFTDVTAIHTDQG
jgi:hypothetical protein